MVIEGQAQLDRDARQPFLVFFQSSFSLEATASQIPQQHPSLPPDYYRIDTLPHATCLSPSIVSHLLRTSTTTYRWRNNSSASSSFSSSFTGRNSPDPIPAPQSFASPEPQSHPAHTNKMMGLGVPNAVPSQSRYMEHQLPGRSYDKDEHGVQRPRKSKANKLLGLTFNEGTTFSPPVVHVVVLPPLSGARPLEG